jgi:hypothetical protein
LSSGLVRLFTYAAAAAAFAPAFANGLDFDRTFAAGFEPRQSHYVATYRLGGTEHRVEVWRDRDLSLKRRTDDRIEIHVTKSAGDVEWTMVVLDLKRKIATRVERTNLMRIGHFTDWFALSHSLSRPAGAYELVAITRGAPRVKPVASCRWYLLTQGGRASKICWSAPLHLPLVIAESGDQVQWKIVDVDSRPLPTGTFTLDDRDFIRNNADQDIQAD